VLENDITVVTDSTAPVCSVGERQAVVGTTGTDHLDHHSNHRQQQLAFTKETIVEQLYPLFKLHVHYQTAISLFNDTAQLKHTCVAL